MMTDKVMLIDPVRCIVSHRANGVETGEFVRGADTELLVSHI